MIKLIFMILLCTRILAASPGSTSLSFLKIDSGARASALAGAFSSYGNDAFAIFYNPSLGLNVDHHRIDIFHYEYFSDLRFENLSGVFRVHDNYAIGLGLGYLYSGDILKTIRAENMEGYTESGTFTTSDLLLLLSHSFRISQNFISGIGIKYISETIDKQTASTFALDIGVLYRVDLFIPMNIGLSLLNMGIPIQFVEKKENLPFIIKAGFSFGLDPLRLNKKGKKDISFTFDFEKPSDNDLSCRLGSELFFIDMFSVGLGYRYRFNQNDLGDISFGAGIEINYFSINYAFVPYKYLGNTHRFSLGIKF
ncbi:MAG: PorV/PorQ family protein [Spirochaetes bacterium]|nr:PorV/PorQ family protein [Spirochaetota bacterium]